MQLRGIYKQWNSIFQMWMDVKHLQAEKKEK